MWTIGKLHRIRSKMHFLYTECFAGTATAMTTGKNYLVTKMDLFNKIPDKAIYTHAHSVTHCTHNGWWLVLGRVTTKEDYPRLRIADTSDIWRVIKFYLLTYLLYNTFTSAMNAIKLSPIKIHYSR